MFELSKQGGFSPQLNPEFTTESEDFLQEPRRPNRGSKFSIENPLLQTQDDISIRTTQLNISSSTSPYPRKTKRLSKDDLEIDTKSLLMASACRPVKWNGRNKKIG